MKTRNTLVIAAMSALLLSASAFSVNAQPTHESATEERSASSKLSILQIKPLQFRFSYSSPASKNILVRILDSSNNVLYSENKRVETNYLKYFDLSTLGDGVYTFEITDGKEKASQSFDILTTTSRAVSSIN